MDAVKKLSEGLQKAQADPDLDADQRKLVELALDPGTACERVSKYAWDEGKTFVNLYITLSGAHDQSYATCTFEGQAFRMRCFGIGGKNYEFAVPNLRHPIDPERSVLAMKPDQVRLKLKKVKCDAKWDALDDSSQVKMDEARAMAKEGASMEELMENMYKNVDDETREQLRAQFAGKTPF